MKTIWEMSTKLYILATEFEAQDSDWNRYCTRDEFAAVMCPDSEAREGMSVEDYEEAIDEAYKMYAAGVKTVDDILA